MQRLLYVDYLKISSTHNLNTALNESADKAVEFKMTIRSRKR